MVKYGVEAEEIVDLCGEIPPKKTKIVELKPPKSNEKPEKKKNKPKTQKEKPKPKIKSEQNNSTRKITSMFSRIDKPESETIPNITMKNEHPVDSGKITEPHAKIITKPHEDISEHYDPSIASAGSNPSCSESSRSKDDPITKPDLAEIISLSKNL